MQKAPQKEAFSWHDESMTNMRESADAEDPIQELNARLERAQIENGRLKAMLGRVQERLQAHEAGDSALYEENALYRAIFDAQSDLGEGFFVVDGRRIEQVNEAFARISGYSIDELKAFEAFFDLIIEEERDALMRRMAARLEGGAVHDHYETAIRHKNGQRVDLEVAVKVIHLGDRPRVMAIARDITARKQMEAALQAQNTRLQDLDALKSIFISTVSHELRTPLATVMGYTEFLEEQVGGSLSAEQQHFVSQIHLGAKRLEILVDDMLDFARLESGSLRLNCQEGDLVMRIHEVAERFKAVAAEKGLTLCLQLPDEPVIVYHDEDRVAQVLSNLLSNAVKFTPQGGEIRLALRREEDRARVSVADTGLGISSEQLPYLFQRFYQVDPSSTRRHGGAGLGLAIAKALVESHGGRIGIDSQVNEGTCVWFELPIDCSVTIVRQAGPQPN